MRASAWWALAAVVVPAAHAQDTAPVGDSARVAAIVAAARAEHHAAGIVAAVLRTGREPIVVAEGVANAARGTPLRHDAMLAVGSITKELTAAAVMQLVESGRLSLDDSVERWLPGFQPGGHRVTVRRLLTHTSGLHGSLRPDSAGALPRTVFDFTPGAGWAYGNAGYLLLGRIIERASGVSWSAYVRTRLAPAAALRHTMPGTDAVAQRGDRVADGHRVVGDTPMPTTRADLTAAFTAGGLYASAGDVVRWADALAHGRVVTPASYALMTTATRLDDGSMVPYGSGIMLSMLGGHPEHMHEGDIDGFSAGVVTYPRDSLSIAVLSNTEGIPALRVARRVARALLRVALDSAPDLPLPERERSRLVGLYAAGASIACRVVSVGEGIGYTCGNDSPRRMRHRGGGVFEELDSPEWRLEFSGLVEDGSAHATGWTERYYGLPMTTARWVGDPPPPVPRRRGIREVHHWHRFAAWLIQ